MSRGQKAVSIDLGVMQDDGWLAANPDLLARWVGSGQFIPITQAHLHAVLDHYCDAGLAVRSERESQIVLGIEVPDAWRRKGLPDPHWVHTWLWSHVERIALAHTSVSATGGKQVNHAAVLAQAKSVREAATLVAEAFVKRLAASFSIPREQMDVKDSLHKYGVDSLVAVELRNWFSRDFGVDVAIFDLLSGTTFAAMGMSIARKSPHCAKIRAAEGA